MRPKSLQSALFTLAFLAIAAFAGASSAIAQLRSIPDDAKRGHMRYVREMIVEIDGEQARLSPGSQIRGVENRIILPSALPQDSVLVKYTTDAASLVHRVWILTPEEAAKPDKKQ